MNFSQRFGLFILIAITVAYIYFTYFDKDFSFINPNLKEEQVYNPLETSKSEEKLIKEDKKTRKNIKIFMLNNSGELRSLNRVCDTRIFNTCITDSVQRS